jgi:hypothetical protein
MEFYELKPNSASSRPKGIAKLQGFLAISDAIRPSSFPPRLGLGYDRGVQYSPNRRLLVWDGTWFGSPVKVRLHWELDGTEKGLLLYDICVEVSGALLLEVLQKALVKMIVAALLLLFVPVAGGVAVLASNSPLEDSVGAGGTNRTQDARYVQALLNDWRGLNGLPLIAVDGLAQSQTIAAIRDFQGAVTGVVDGRVDVGGAAITALQQAHIANAINSVDRSDMDSLGTDGLALLVLRPDPDGEGAIADLEGSLIGAVAQYLVELHAQV